MSKNGSRNAGLDLLRIISMIMVVTLHYFNADLGGVLGVATGVTYYAAWTIESFCYCAVNVFVLISGYFLCDREKTNTKKVIELLLQVAFYSIGLYVLGCVTGICSFNPMTLVTRYLLPTSSGLYWFVTDYVILYLLAPYLSLGLKGLTKEQHGKLCLLMVAIFSVIPTIEFFQIDVMGLEGGYSFIWFVVLFVTASYIKKYPVSLNKWLWLFGYVVLSLVTAMGKFMQQWILRQEFFELYSYCSVTVFLASVCLFCFFLSFKELKAERIIGKIAPYCFGVFLIHTHTMWTDWLWDDVIRGTEHVQNPAAMILHMIPSVLGIFILCAIADFIRSQIFNLVKKLSE